MPDMVHGRGIVALGCCVVTLSSAGCSSKDLDSDVSGVWCGREVRTPEECVGEEVEYLELRQEDGRVTGVICEAYNKDCTAVEGGTLDGNQLTFGFDPRNVQGRAELTLREGVLDGTLYSGKCACHLPYTFHRL
jgi:hypothetical protein